MHYFAIKHDIKSNEFKMPDTLEQGQYAPLIFDWLCNRYELPPYKHSFKDRFMQFNIWGNQLWISFDFRCEEQKELFDKLPNEIKGTKQKGTGKMVNLKSLYFTVSDLISFEYPYITDVKLFHHAKSKDNDGDDFNSYTWLYTLSDGSKLYHLNQSLTEIIDKEHTFPANIQTRAFCRYLKGLKP